MPVANPCVAWSTGRDAELATLSAHLGPDSPTRAVVLTGEAGIGKTTLWELGITQARDRGMWILATRASSAEAQLPFAALIDLCDTVDLRSLSGVSEPQRQALEVALMRATPARRPPQPHAIALGLRNALRTLAERQPVMVAIDDIQWLDQPSSDALAFAARRLAGEAIRFLVTRRTGPATELEHAFARGSLDRAEVGPLGQAAIRRLLVERLGLRLPRDLLRKVVESSGGNPLFALELGRSFVERGLPQLGEDIPLPDAVEDMLGTRVTGLPPPVRRVLLAVALTAQPRIAELTPIAGPEALEDAIDAGILIVDGERVRASHPLLAAAARKRSRPRERRVVHRVLAESVADDEIRILHRALAAEGPDEDLGAATAGAAAAVYARGARHQAVHLAEQALRLTPPGSPCRDDRLLTLADYLDTAGEAQRMTDLLTAEVTSLAPGPTRARAWLLLCDGVVETMDEANHLLDRALAECSGDHRLRAHVHAKQAIHAAGIALSGIHRAEALARDALDQSEGTPDTEALARHALAWAVALGGRTVDDLCTGLRTSSPAPLHIVEAPERVAGQRCIWRGEVQPAREILERLRDLADERGERLSHTWIGLHLCDLDLRAGDWESAARLLDLWADSSDRDAIPFPIYERCRALLSAGRGLVGDARAWAEKAIAHAEAVGSCWDVLEAQRARGLAALLDGDPAQAVGSLRPVWEHMLREGIDDPGAFPVAPELVEALAELGELGEAAAVTDRVRELAERQRHPWGLATATRCGAVVVLTSDAYDEIAVAELARAAGDYERLGLRFDQARSLLLLGRAQRRRKKWGAARDSLEAAAAAFEELGSPGWVEAARSELARVGARRPSPRGELTAAQLRTAHLAAEGLTNKEIACALHVTVHTVEVHLSRAYATLGVRSRRQLRDALPGRQEPPKD